MCVVYWGIWYHIDTPYQFTCWQAGTWYSLVYIFLLVVKFSFNFKWKINLNILAGNFLVSQICTYVPLVMSNACFTGMDAQVSYAFHHKRKKHPEKFKNQLANQVLLDDCCSYHHSYPSSVFSVCTDWL